MPSVTPDIIARADYPIIQKPLIGGEALVYASTNPAGLKKIVRKVGSSSYEEKIYSSTSFDSTNGVDVVTVGIMGLTGSVSGVIEIPDWCPDKKEVFQAGKAGEGTLASPYTFGVRGEELMQIEIPQYNPDAEAADKCWNEIGAVTDLSYGVPSRESKAIAEGLISNRWNKPGKTTIPEFSLTANNFGLEQGLSKLAGRKVHIMLRLMCEGLVEVGRVFVLDWTPVIEGRFPAGGDDSSLTARGSYSAFAFISAPGTPEA